jgi:hypothetical protein
MHFESPADLTDVTAETLLQDATAACVAGCYRCVLSYYNQPDHETIDRRDAAMKTALLRLARSQTALSARAPDPDAAAGVSGVNLVQEWRAALSARGLDASDLKLTKFNGTENIIIWPDHCVAASLG